MTSGSTVNKSKLVGVESNTSSVQSNLNEVHLQLHYGL